MADFEKFIHDLAFQLNLSTMNDAQRARLKEYRDKNVGTKDQIAWRPDDPNPDPAVAPYDIVNDADWDELYLAFQSVLYKMNDGRKGVTDYHNDATKFLDDFYGAGKCIAPFKASPTLVGLVTANTTQLVSTIESLSSYLSSETGISSRKIHELTTKIIDGSYVSDKAALDMLGSLCGRILSAIQFGTAIITLPNGFDAVLQDIYNEVGNNTPPTTAERDNFKANYVSMVKRLVSKEEARKVFAENDDTGYVSYSIRQALRHSDYSNSDSKNYLPPKYADRKRFFDRAKKKVTDWKDDVFGKWESRHKRHIYSTNAKDIVGEIIKKKIKPTDGLEAILKNKDDIKPKLTPKVRDEFDFLTKTLSKFKDLTAFKEATKDGDQMRYLVQEIILDSVNNDKEKEAKVVLEVLAMMRYGAMTSSVRDNLKKANSEVSILSDKSLSFNKNPFTQDVTKTIDKVLKTGVELAFEGANLLKNKLVRQKGVKFKNGTKRIQQIAKSTAYKDPAKRAKMEELFAFWDFVNKDLTKDYNPFMKHSDVLKKYTSNITVGGTTTRLIDQKFDDFFHNHNIGR